MFQQSRRAARIKPSPAIAVSVQAKALARQGIDVVDLSVGEPDFDTPAHVRAAAVVAMEAGETHYTAADGTAALKQAIAAAFLRDYGLRFEPAEITAANGAKQVICNALLATLDPGDEVIVPAPYWVSYTDLVLLADGTPVEVACPAAAGFKLSPEALEAAITPRSRWLLLNAPSNPTGAAYSEAELKALGEVLDRHPHVMILADEIYDLIRYDGGAPLSFLSVNPGLRGRTLVVNGVSKAYAMTGWRLGYGAGPAELVTAMAKIQSQATSNPSSISQAAAIAALTGPQDFVATALAEYQARRDLVMELLEDIPQLTPHRPDGAFYVYIDCSALIGCRSVDGSVLEDDAGVARFLLDVARVAVVPGAAFGAQPFFRISFATSRVRLTEGCTRMAAAIKDLTR
ncbi:aminotransferase class I/II-fold pyridoxal phosphate-dependent enzyme [Arenibacterium sp. LLYu02]|uniref:aminotransferase class I/II-fold pyridoxal phosphate-dependent enzyme n=1 Tax=Arenibacterium sp. LLYu02 TaxID=3404132 RepID=UPI003B212180